jgi:hypothetical protein
MPTASALAYAPRPYPPSPEGPTTVGMYLLLAEIGSDYRGHRISDTDYVTMAQMAGLTRQAAIDRCLRLDDAIAPARAQYRKERRDLLHRCQSARFDKQDGSSHGRTSLFFHQRELVRLRIEYYGAKQGDV